MKRHLLLKSLVLLCALVVGSGNLWADPTYEWVLVEDYSSLSTSDTYVIAGNIGNGTTWYSLKNNQVTSAGNLPIGSTLTIVSKKITSTVSSDETWVLEATGTSGQYYIKSTKGSYYLQNAGATGSTIKSKSDTDNNNQWKIHHTETNTNTLKSVTGLYNVGQSREFACYNSSPVTWRCYASANYGNIADDEVVLYRRVETSGGDPSSAVAFANSAVSMDLKDAATFTQTATTAEGYAGTPGASVTYSIGSTNTANATINSSTGVVTPTQAGTVVVNASAAAIDGKYLASNASYTLTVTDTREYTVTYHLGDNSYNVTRNSGAALNLEEPSAKYGMAFAGWSSTNNAAIPTWVTNTTKVTGNMELYAIYEAVAGKYSYRLVESSQADWRGDYLIAYSSTIFADGRTGGTEGIGANGTSANPSTSLSGKVVAGAWGDTYNVTIEAINDSKLSDGYLMKTKDGKYNYQASNSNGLASTDTRATAANYPLSITFNSSFDIDIANSAGAQFHYNTGDNGYFRFYKNGGQNSVYLYKRTADTAPTYSLGNSLGTTESVTIGSSKYAAYCSSSALDFSGTDVKAYKAKVNEGKVVLTLVNYVPANEGVILYGDADDYDVPQIAAAGAVSDNELIGVTTRTLVEWETGDDGKYNYILQNGQFKKAAAGGHLKANRAYLHTSYNVESSARDYLEFSFEGEEEEEDVTGVTDVRSKMSDVRGDFYNLNGQKVQNPTKGLYIVNGKKVVVK